MLTERNFAKVISACFIVMLSPLYSWAQCAPNITALNNLSLNYFTQDNTPGNLSTIDVELGDGSMDGNYSVNQAGTSWATLGEDFSEISLEGKITINFNDGSPPLACFYNSNGNLIENPLPVELNSLEGRLEKNDIYLSWTTLSENQNAGFEIERSFDGERFETIESINGAGTTEDKQNYNFTDSNIRSSALGETVYYRLKQIDFDGKSNYSPVVSIDLKIEITGFEITKITGWNSPERLLKVYFHNPAQIRKIQFQVADLNGRSIKNQAFYPAPGLQYLELDLSGLQEQMYFISLNNGKEVISKKIVLTRL